MSFSHLIAGLAERVWGLKDRDYSPFFVITARKELTLDRSDLDLLVLARLKAIIKHAKQTSVYYAKAFADYGISEETINSLDDIQRFPFLTRDILRERLPEIISGGTILPCWAQSATGGTTSSPVVFYCDDKALWKKNAFTRVIDGWFGRKTGDRVAFLWGAPQDMSGRPTIGSQLRNITYRHSLMVPSAPLDDQILSDHYQKLYQWQPSFLQAYPTPLHELCLYMQQNGLSLPSLKAVSVTAETLYHGHRQLIEETLNLQLYNWYGSRELGRVASECECHTGMHINEPSVYVEIEPDSLLPDGCGHLIVTDLLNRATPFIRYRTGDIASFVEGECPCGRSLRRIASIEGRLTDLIVLPGGRKVPGVSLTNRVVKDFLEISEMQIVQKTVTEFLVRYVKGPNFKVSTLDGFLESFYSLLDMRVSVDFEELRRLPRERSGKVRFVISHVSGAYDAVR